MTCPEGCEEHNDSCASCWRERALYFERRALDAEAHLKDGAKVCRKRTAERDEARQVAHELCFPPEGRTQAVLRTAFRTVEQQRDDARRGIEVVRGQLQAILEQVERQRDEAREVARRCYSPHTSPLMNLDTGRPVNELVRWPWLMNQPVALDGDDLT